jgi:pimeloyl-ACP methyl ester carboxylesterase
MPKVEYLDRTEGKIAYEDYGGAGTLVVCIPGMGDLRSVYRFVAPAFAERGHRVVTMDLRGMGDSSVTWSDYSESAIGSDIVALIEHLQTGPAVLVGNSISAGAAVWVAAEHPEAVAGLVLVSPFARQVPISRLKVFLFRLALARPWGAAAWVGYQTGRLYPSAKPGDMPDYRLALRAKLRERGRMKAFQRMAGTNHLAAEARLGRVMAPVLIVMGTADPDFPDPRSEASLLRERLHGTAVLLDGVGHYPQAENPQAFSDKVLDFLAREVHAA